MQAAKVELKVLVEAAERPETNKLYRTSCRWWNEIEVLVVTGATIGESKQTTPESGTTLPAAIGTPAITKRLLL